MTIGEEAGELPAVLDVLENAYMLMELEEVTSYDGSDLFYGGQAAYEAWAAALEDDEMSGKDADVFTATAGHNDQINMLSEGRFFAAIYMNSLAENQPDFKDDFLKCASLLKSASGCANTMHEMLDGKPFHEKQLRSELAALVRRAAQYEEDACTVLKTILEKLGGGKTKRSLSLYKFHVQKVAQDFADAIHDTPTDYPLRDSVPESFKENLKQLRILVKDMYADMALEPEAWGLKLVAISEKDKNLIRNGNNTIRRLFGILGALAECGDLVNHQLHVSVSAFTNSCKGASNYVK